VIHSFWVIFARSGLRILYQKRYHLFYSIQIQYKAIYLVVDLMEKFIPVRNAKLQVMDKIMDKMWKTLKGFLRTAMDVCATPYPQPSASASKPQ